MPREVPGKGPVPRLARGGERGRVGGEHLLDGREIRLEPGSRLTLGRREKLEHRLLARTVGIGGVVEDRVEAEEVPLRKRVVLVVVTLGTGDRRAHPGGEGGVHAVHDRHRAEFLVDRAPLAVGERVAVEGGGDAVLGRGLGQEIAGDLADRELIEGHVRVEGGDHPVTPAPDRARPVIGVAGAVGVAGEVEPLPGEVLTASLVREQKVDEPSDRVLGAIGREGVDHLGIGRQAGQIEREAAGEHGPRRLRLWREPLGLEPREDEAIDVVLRPGGVLHGGHGRPDRRHVRPVGLVAGAGRDPVPQ